MTSSARSGVVLEKRYGAAEEESTEPRGDLRLRNALGPSRAVRSEEAEDVADGFFDVGHLVLIEPPGVRAEPLLRIDCLELLG